MSKDGSVKSIPAVRRVLINDPSQLPSEYGTTPGGSLFSTTPGGRKSFENAFIKRLLWQKEHKNSNYIEN